METCHELRVHEMAFQHKCQGCGRHVLGPESKLKSTSETVRHVTARESAPFPKQREE